MPDKAENRGKDNVFSSPIYCKKNDLCFYYRNGTDNNNIYINAYASREPILGKQSNQTGYPGSPYSKVRAGQAGL